ncbi:tyrosine-type recombinase/integrase [Alkaliflexus imshenetskii]|uniref:tyrosine-type recombinase/integrase n=1 Tax=Alkaliflexus imshenetskii TaxID=286730 RepID=UPI0004BA5469|nr:tyrosine-type recombinase/integrase [Alkaliflexus imshenetskii]
MTHKSVNREIKSKQFLHLVDSFTIWLETLGYKARSIKQMNWNAQEFFAFLESQGTRYLRDFKNKQVNQYLEYLQHRPNCNKTGGLSPGYINKHITMLRLLSKYLQFTGKANILIKPQLLKTTETATYLTKTEIQALYQAAKDENNLYHQRDTAMLSLFYGCGLRASEGEALNINDILFEKGLVYVRKGKNYRERYVPMNKQVRINLKNYITDQRNELLQGNKTDALLLGRRGERWSVQGMYHRLQHLKNRATNEALKQKSFGLHILRHSIATHLLQDGMKLEYISRFLGHKSLETTQKYTHLAKEEDV